MKHSITIFCLLILFCMALAPIAAADWTIETILSTGDVGIGDSMGIDAAGNLHISYIKYHSLYDKDLMYATNATGTWVEETVEGVTVVAWCSLAVEPSGVVHISYYDSNNYELRYATNASGAWTNTKVSYGGCPNSIAVDGSGHAHISYYRSNDLWYATNASGSWFLEEVDTQGKVGTWSSIVVDSASVLHIGYYDLTNGDLKYAENSSGSWNKETVDSAYDVGYLCDIALDSLNRAHISYHDYSHNNLKYARQTGAGWVIEVADAEYYTGSSNSITLDSSDNPHISYNEYSVLKYATRFSGAWLSEIVDSTLFTGGGSCIAVDASDTLHIGYQNSDKGGLFHAYGTGLVPLASDVDEISCATGGTANYALYAGAMNANRGYLLLGGVSGTAPGTPLPGGHVTLPLNYDAFTNIVINLMNTAFFSNFQANLDVEGRSTAQLNIPALPAVFLPMYYAYALPGPWDFASNPVRIDLVP